ncbi:hypothetical protein [Thermococcus sp.]|uniref:hypothetical protein n=1 Tax=Thermococcus sp. TaxID=35749 RepID=UPI0025FBACEF|nr:hypothetical protein [Thermococcus sp.]
MRPRSIVVLFFLLLSIYFFSLAVLSYGQSYMFPGFTLIGTFHLLFAVGVYSGNSIAVDGGTYVAFLDLIFGIIWMISLFSLPAVSLTLLSGLALFILMDEDVRTELKGRGRF